MSSGSRTTRRATVHPGLDTETLAVFERWYSAHEAGDVAKLGAVLADDVTVHSLFRSEPVHTRDAALAHFARTTTTFSDLVMGLVSNPTAAANGAVLAEVVFTGTFTGELTWRDRVHRGAGQPFEVPGVVVIRTDQRGVISVRTLFDRDDWLRQIGVPPG